MIRKTNLANKSNYGGARSVSNIKYIVVHYTGNDGDTDEANANYFNGGNRKASAHYFVDDDSVTQSVPDNYVAWHCGTSGTYYNGCRNANSIGVEMCDTQRNGSYNLSAATRANAIELIRELMGKYNIPITNVVRHYDVTHKNCPAYFVSDAGAWNQFLADINGGTNVVGGTITFTPVSTNANEIIRQGQVHANNFAQCGIATDGIRGNNTKIAGKRVLQRAMNCDYDAGLDEDGDIGSKSKRALNGHYVKQGETQYMVTALEILLMLKGYDPHGVECPGIFGDGLCECVKSYQKDHDLAVDGVAGYNTFMSLIS